MIKNERKPQEEQFSGSLIGQCLGDALGFVVEGYPPAVCQQYVTEELKMGHAGEYGRGHFAFGQYSDDSQLARELLQSYLTCKRFDPQDYSRRIAAIFAEGRIVGRGRATDEAAKRLAQGVPWDEAGTPPPSAGNGSAMRAGPIGLLFFDDPDRMIKAAYDQGRITHRDNRCSAGAVAIAGAVALALCCGSIDTHQFLVQLSDWVKGIDQSTGSYIQQLESWVALQPEESVTFISRVGMDPGFTYDWQGISPFVTSSVLWSLYSFLRSPKDYWETICTAIKVGGDVDTTAAMAGAISGAHSGFKTIPLHLAHRLTDQGTWGLDELIDLAHKCYQLKMKNVLL